MHNPEFTFPMILRRSVVVPLTIISLCLIAAGCRQQSESPAPALDPAPAAVEAEQPVTLTPSELDSPAGAVVETPIQPKRSTAEAAAATDTATDAPTGKLQLRLPPNQQDSEDGAPTPVQETQPMEGEEQVADDDEYEIDPEILAHIQAQERALRRIADAYSAPPGAKQLGKQPDLWVDVKAKRVYVDGYVTMRQGPLEMFACPVGTKEHESVVAVFAKSSEVHAALLAIGAQSGTPVRWNPDFLPPTGQTIQVWATWRSPKPSSAPEAADDTDPSTNTVEFVPGEEFHAVDAREWVRNMKTQTKLDEPWVFAGSTFWSDPEDNTEHYSADAGDMICVSNFTSSMLDVPFKSSADAGNLLFEPFTENIPERGTPVRLVLVPQPIPSDQPAEPQPVDPTAPPEIAVLPIAASAAQNTPESNP